MKLKSIGIINSPYKTRAESPHQGRYSEELSKITIFEGYTDGLLGIGDKKYLLIFYWQDEAERDKLQIIPRGKTKKKGVFATRAPVRPNPIALCLVELVEVDGRTLTVKWLDALDGSPLLDIKPFSAEIDCL
jgi:tRNA (adenine37-N6)-methyltransferase